MAMKRCQSNVATMYGRNVPSGWCSTSQNRTQCSSTRDKHDRPIESRFDQDRPDQWRAIVVADRSRRVGYQHCFSDDERRAGGQHEAAKRRTITGNEQVGCQQDQVKADEKEDRRRQHFAELAQQEGSGPPRDPDGFIVCFDGGLELGGISVQNRRAPHFALLRARLYLRSNAAAPDLTQMSLRSLRFFADWAAKKWPLRGSLKGPA